MVETAKVILIPLTVLLAGATLVGAIACLSFSLSVLINPYQGLPGPVDKIVAALYNVILLAASLVVLALVVAFRSWQWIGADVARKGLWGFGTIALLATCFMVGFYTNLYGSYFFARWWPRK